MSVECKAYTRSIRSPRNRRYRCMYILEDQQDLGNTMTWGFCQAYKSMMLLAYDTLLQHLGHLYEGACHAAHAGVSRGRRVSEAAVAEKKIAILEQALKYHPGSDELLLALLTAAEVCLVSR